MKKVTAGRDALGDFAPKFAELNDDVLFGEVWSREDKLPARDRSIVTVTALMASGVLDSSLAFHIGEAKKNGVTKEEMAEILTHAAFMLAGRKHGQHSAWQKKSIRTKEENTMLGNFSYSNPTKLYFGEESLCSLNEELPKYGKTVQLIYGGGSIKKNGIYDQVMELLKSNGKVVIEDGGVMPNPTVEKLREGVRIARENHVDFLLAVGGGSCCDYAKAVSVSVHCDEDPWEKYYIRFEEPDCEIVPVGCVLTMVGTGSEMNGGAVITNHDQKLKIGHVFGDAVMPKFAILNPKFTFTLPKKQMVAGIYDIFNHICEQYFSGEDDNTSDYISEALMKSVIHSSRIAIRNPEDYEARSNIMWAATWALNTLVSRGKSTDWMVHMLGQAVGAYTDATHGMTLSAVSLPYYRYIMPYGLSKFCRFAVNVWEVDPAGKADEQVAREGLSCMEVWMKELGLTMNLHELGATEEMLQGIANGTLIMEGGYKVLNHDEVLEILKNSL